MVEDKLGWEGQLDVAGQLDGFGVEVGNDLESALIAGDPLR
jgi:hypothetical protein